ncbi:hypothetical protein IC617_16580 [Neiella sp. HB171785]|uniref:DUF1311 domain-containing protein n=1 Tax=Neiella litorisoli TaxID=2771431 RepID=A0A8J6R415_9GAMM|nr:hypothetical protein [Neiella litorisoli]MBD1391045.1 hypothetical protein [Neiella litorisoli]
MTNPFKICLIVVLICWPNAALLAASKPYPTTSSMDRKCLYLAKQMNRTIKKLKKDPIDKRQLQADLHDYQLEWKEHRCDDGGKAETASRS